MLRQAGVYLHHDTSTIYVHISLLYMKKIVPVLSISIQDSGSTKRTKYNEEAKRYTIAHI